MGTGGSRLRPEVIDDLLASTHFKEREIRMWYRGFMRSCPRGYATLDDFKRIYKQFFPDGNSDSFAELVFKRFDENGDESVSFREFIVALSDIWRGDFERKMYWAFKLYDQNDDGFIEYQEMLHVITAIFNMVDSAEMHLPFDERTPELRTKKIFRRLDTDKDGKIGQHEFISTLRKDTKVVRMLHR